MTISDELEAKILRYFHVEKWTVGTISRQLNIHRDTVKRVLVQSGNAKVVSVRPSQIDPYLPFIIDTLKKYPNLTASRLYHMVVARGYVGGPDHFRHLIALHRPRITHEAYFRLKTLPGEQAQVDWGNFGYITIGEAKRSLMAFVMVLSYSRKIFLRFYLNQSTANFLDGHEAAFTAWGGVPRVIQYDNLKSAVLERHGDAIHFNPLLLSFAAHYRFEPRPVAIARGNEKGRVERAIRYIRTSFFAARTWKDLEDLNAQAITWCNAQAADRPCPEDPKLSVREVFDQERVKLLPLPENPYPIEEKKVVKVGKTPYVRFDLNDYSVPHNYVCCTLTVIAKANSVTIVDGSKIVAKHKRSYDKGRQVELESHLKELGEHKQRASKSRGQDRLVQAVPISRELLIKAAERSYNLGGIISVLLQLLDSYGATELEIAINEALTREVPHPNAVRLCLERRRENRNQPPPIALKLPDDKRIRDLVVRTHDLGSYDQLKILEKNGENNE
jgi:transposase